MFWFWLALLVLTWLLPSQGKRCQCGPYDWRLALIQGGRQSNRSKGLALVQVVRPSILAKFRHFLSVSLPSKSSPSLQVFWFPQRCGHLHWSGWCRIKRGAFHWGRNFYSRGNYYSQQGSTFVKFWKGNIKQIRMNSWSTCLESFHPGFARMEGVEREDGDR